MLKAYQPQHSLTLSFCQQECREGLRVAACTPVRHLHVLTRYILIHLDVRPTDGSAHPLRLCMKAVELESEAEVMKGGVEICKGAILGAETRLHQLMKVPTLLLMKEYRGT